MFFAGLVRQLKFENMSGSLVCLDPNVFPAEVADHRMARDNKWKPLHQRRLRKNVRAHADNSPFEEVTIGIPEKLKDAKSTLTFFALNFSSLEVLGFSSSPNFHFAFIFVQNPNPLDNLSYPVSIVTTIEDPNCCPQPPSSLPSSV